MNKFVWRVSDLAPFDFESTAFSLPSNWLQTLTVAFSYHDLSSWTRTCKANSVEICYHRDMCVFFVCSLCATSDSSSTFKTDLDTHIRK